MFFPMCVTVTACTPCAEIKLDYIYIHELYFELVVSMKLWCLLEPSSAQGDSVGLSRLGKALPWIRVSNRRIVKSSIMKRGYLYERMFTSESMIHMPCF